MAGVCAAIECAREGTRVALINSRPMLGGNASSEIRVHISGADQSLKQPEYAESGLLYELMLENKARNEQFSYSIWDMILFEATQKEKNLTCFHNTVMYDCETEGNRITSVLCVQETTEMRFRISGKIFVDATGNGTLGYYAGAGFRMGSEARAQTGEPDAPDEPNHDTMGNTIMFKARDMGHPVKFTPPAFANRYTEYDLRYRMHCSNQTLDFSGAKDPAENRRTGGCSARGIDYGYFWIELMGDGVSDIIPQYEGIRDNLLAVLYGVWDHIKNGGDHLADNYALEWVGILPGTRESRRLEADYMLTENDILENRIFDDAVAYGGWCIDVHTPGGMLDTDRLPSGDCVYFHGVYTIPYRSYCSRDISNMFMAGRDIGCTRLAYSSTRILGCCGVGGQAVGAAASMCVKKNLLPRELQPFIGELQQTLLKHDAFIPGFASDGRGDLVRSAAITASSSAQGCPPEKITDGIGRTLGDDMHAWKSCGIAPEGERLSVRFADASDVNEIRLTFETNFSYPIRVTMSRNRQIQQRDGIAPEIVRDYDIVLRCGGETVKTLEIRGNYQRLNVIPVGGLRCDGFDVIVRATNGLGDAIIHEVRAY